MEAINLNGFELAYTRFGDGVPLILIHGYPLDHTIWYDVVSSSRSFSLICAALG